MDEASFTTVTPSFEKKEPKMKSGSFFAIFLISMLAVTLIPLFVTAGISYFQCQNLLQSESESYIKANAQWQEKIVETFINDLKSVIYFVTSEYDHKKLAMPGEAEKLLSHLKQRYPYIADFGILNPDGIQEIYAGPYKLQGKSYAETDWFHRTVEQGFYVSTVFSGFRGTPHFVFATTKKEKEDSSPWVFRVSVHADTLKKFIETSQTYLFDDVFVINAKGFLQTSSSLHGDIGDACSSAIMPQKSGITVIDKGLGTVEIMAPLEGTPWILVLTKKGFLFQKKWIQFQEQLFFNLIISVLIIIAVVVRIAFGLTARIEEAKAKRDEATLQAQHSGKLASIGRLAAGVAHEINNPLAVIDQKAGLAMDILDMTSNCADKERLEAQMQGIIDATTRCKTITHRLLGFARRMDVSFEEIEVNVLVDDVLGFVEKEAVYRNIKIVKEYDPILPRIISDRGQLQQIFLNIINNGMDAIEENGTLFISSKELVDHIAVEIRDTGTGIPPQVIQHVFDPFFTTKKPGKGTGLGLSITYGLVKKLGGDIIVSSEVGKGALFTVILPLKVIQGKE
jgi:two-component system, NtrC family, sensor kinase